MPHLCRRISGCGKSFRLQRIFRRHGERAFIVPMDHSLTDGPLGSANRVDEIVGLLARHGGDAVVLHKGRVGLVDDLWLARIGLIVHLSGSTAGSVEPTAKVLVAGVEEAIALGADAVSVHVNVGSPTESSQLADLGAVAGECARLGLPLLAMMYARRANAADDMTPSTLAHLASIAVDLGADVVKLTYSGSPQSMREVIATSPVPIVVAGGPPRGSEQAVLDLVTDAVASGASGVAIGRNVFTAKDPASAIRRISQIVHSSLDTARSDRPVAAISTSTESSADVY